MNNPQKIIECKNVFKSFSTKNGITNAVNGVNLSINKGECYGLVGESGCGKSTLSSLICALQKPDSGEILFEGKTINGGGMCFWKYNWHNANVNYIGEMTNDIV